MVCNVPVAEAISDEGVLPECVQEALGQLVGAAKEGLLALSVEVGLGVLRELLEAEVEELVGPKGRWNRDRTAVRHGHEDGELTLGGRRVQVRRPRARTADGESEVPLVSYEHFADRDQLADVVLERMLAGVSTRQYRRAQEPVGEQVETNARSTSKSAVSRTFVQRTRDQLWNLMNRPLADLRLAVIMLDGIELHGRTNIVALGISTEGDKLALGLWDGSTENATVVAALLADLVDRGLDVEQGLLFVIDGSKALERSRELRVRASDRPDPRATKKEPAVICSTQRTDGTPSRLRGRVCRAGQPRRGARARPLPSGCGAGAADGVRALGAAGASVRQRGAAATGWGAGAGAHGGVHREVGAVADRRTARPGGSDRSDVERGDGRGGGCLSRWCWRAGRWPGVLRSSSSVTGSPARGWRRRTRCWRPTGGV